MSIDAATFRSTLKNAHERLLSLLGKQGYWPGRLSSSALSTATAVFALSCVDANLHGATIRRGLDWLVGQQNRDGGWGDTDKSVSNICTTALCWAALAAGAGRHHAAVAAAEGYLTRQAGSIEPRALARAIAARYGRDRTFSVPILSMLALAGRLGPPREAWRHVPALPFELAACPHQMLRWLRLPVVSYALPALIAIGQARHCHHPSVWPVSRMARQMLRGRTLAVLERSQPASGGFLEAAPLTSFVVMNLQSVRPALADNSALDRVVRSGTAFLTSTVRPDGSWPIDTNLATWVTMLSVNALAVGDLPNSLDESQRQQLRTWLLSQQYGIEHPYTHSPPGGWAWTDLSGGVCDGDDTPGALLALRHLGSGDGEVTRRSAEAGIGWLLQLQNRDGGMPTFCRGWGKLPFDRSSADLTAHAIVAMAAWLDDLAEPLADRAAEAIRRGIAYLAAVQRADGSFLPLWFGNQHVRDDLNPVYGTARVLLALAEVARRDHPPGRRLSMLSESIRPALATMIQPATAWLVAARNAEGGWGGGPSAPPSIEETAVAVDALASVLDVFGTDGEKAGIDLPAETRECIDQGAAWLIRATDCGRRFEPSPIGFYFAKLWYYEQVYPVAMTVAALGRIAKCKMRFSD